MYLSFMNLGYSEILLILLVAVLLFGGKLPKVARDAGRWFYDLKRGMANLNRDIYEPPPYEPPPESPQKTILTKALPEDSEQDDEEVERAFPDRNYKSAENEKLSPNDEDDTDISDLKTGKSTASNHNKEE